MTEATIRSVVGASGISTGGDRGRVEAPAEHHSSRPDESAATPDLRVCLGGFGGFAVLAVVGLLVPVGPLGWRVLALVVVFHVSTVVIARRTGDALLWASDDPQHRNALRHACERQLAVRRWTYGSVLGWWRDSGGVRK